MIRKLFVGTDILGSIVFDIYIPLALQDNWPQMYKSVGTNNMYIKHHQPIQNTVR